MLELKHNTEQSKRILKGHSDYLPSVSSLICTGLDLDSSNMLVHIHTHCFVYFSWHSLLPVVVYPDWTMWLPCGCQAAPLLCGNWCLWWCRLAMVLWLTGLATCPALAASVAWKGVQERGRGGTGRGGGVGGGMHVTRIGRLGYQIIKDGLLKYFGCS